MTADNSILAYLKSRKSVPLSMMTQPGPSPEQLTEMLEIAARSPDHGRMEPWRFVIYRDAAGEEIGEKLAALALERQPDIAPDQLERDRNRLRRAPVAIGVVSSIRNTEQIPDWEQFLSAGAVAMNLVHAANALGFAANWVTGWFCDHPEGRAILGLAPRERMAGIVHIGSCERDIPERPRPDAASLVSEYSGPYKADS